MPAPKIEIQITESFPHLAHAPITEAVLEVKTRAEGPWEEAEIREALGAQLPDYPKMESRREMEQKVLVQPGKIPEHTVNDLGWTGIGCRSEDEKQVGQFHRDAFSFSRLQPYETWEQFEAEAVRLWRIHAALARPSEVQRVGLRFINKIPVPTGGLDLDDYLVTAPRDPKDLPLPFAGFFHHDVLAVPGHAYGINLIRTIQPPLDPKGGPTLILDIDVFTTEPFGFVEEVLEQRLAEMRWLKNKVFFGSITNITRESLQ